MESLARILLLLLAFALALAYLHGGAAGVKRWINAKFAVSL